MTTTAPAISADVAKKANAELAKALKDARTKYQNATAVAKAERNAAMAAAYHAFSEATGQTA